MIGRSWASIKCRFEGNISKRAENYIPITTNNVQRRGGVRKNAEAIKDFRGSFVGTFFEFRSFPTPKQRSNLKKQRRKFSKRNWNEMERICKKLGIEKGVHTGVNLYGFDSHLEVYEDILRLYNIRNDDERDEAALEYGSGELRDIQCKLGSEGKVGRCEEMKIGICKKMKELRADSANYNTKFKNERISLKNICFKDNPQNVIARQIWLNASKQFLDLKPLQKNMSKIGFDGRIRPYVNQCGKKWQCSNPTKVYKLDS